MIRSPISPEERLRNRVETLEKEMADFRTAADIIYGLLCATGNGLVETAKRVAEHDESLACIENDIEVLFTHTGL